MENVTNATEIDIRRDIEAVKPRARYDRQIWGIYLSLVAISVVELYSASSREIVNGNIFGPLLRHAGLLGMGALLMLALQWLHYKWLYRGGAYVLSVIFVLSAVYTMYFGLYINGARRAFSAFGLCTIQPSELLKLGAALVIARILSNYIVHYRPGHEEEDRRHNTRLLVWVMLVVLVSALFLVAQGLTNTILLLAISGSMMLIGGVRWGTILKAAGVVVVCAVLGIGAKMVMDSDRFKGPEQTEDARVVDRDATRLNRVLQYLRTDKYNDPITSENSQEQYSYIAQANGGIFGRFPGNSRETARLPLAFSDYIYAIVIEDIGLVGGVCVLLLYLWLLFRAGVIASQCKKAFPALLVLGMAVFIVWQALIHMGIVAGTLPVSGQPLPLISKGGSSVIVTSFALGIMLSVSRHALRKGRKQEANDNIATLSDTELADNPTQL